MRINKFIIGLGMGMGLSKFYDSFKNQIKPEVVKVLGNAIAIRENTKNFFGEVVITAQEQNRENYKKINYASIKENYSNIPDNIDNLKDQLTKIQKQLSKL